jgi:hypothetical protein
MYIEIPQILLIIIYWIYKICKKLDPTCWVQDHNAVIPFYKFSGKLQTVPPINTRECFKLSDFWTTLYILQNSIRM